MYRFANLFSSIVVASKGHYRSTSFASAFLSNGGQDSYQGYSVISYFYILYRNVIYQGMGSVYVLNYALCREASVVKVKDNGLFMTSAILVRMFFGLNYLVFKIYLYETMGCYSVLYVQVRLCRRVLLLVGQDRVKYAKSVSSNYAAPIASLRDHYVVNGKDSRGQGVNYHYYAYLWDDNYVYGGRVRVKECRVVYGYEDVYLLILYVLRVGFCVISRLFLWSVLGSLYYLVRYQVLRLLTSSSIVCFAKYAYALYPIFYYVYKVSANTRKCRRNYYRDGQRYLIWFFRDYSSVCVLCDRVSFGPLPILLRDNSCATWLRRGVFTSGGCYGSVRR